MKSRRCVPLRGTAAGAPFLHSIESLPEKVDPTRYPFNIRAFARGIDLTFRSKVTFFVGEKGGNRDHHRATFADRSPLAQAIRLAWLPKVTQGFFMRAE